MFRAFQVLAAAGGAILFVMGIVAVFRVEFGAGFFETSGSVAGFGFSPALAIACVLLGGAILATSVADQDRGGTAFAALLTLAVGIGALVLEGGADQVGVDRQSALLMVVIGAIVFVLSLLPWWIAAPARGGPLSRTPGRSGARPRRIRFPVPSSPFTTPDPLPRSTHGKHDQHDEHEHLEGRAPRTSAG